MSKHNIYNFLYERYFGEYGMLSKKKEVSDKLYERYFGTNGIMNKKDYNINECISCKEVPEKEEECTICQTLEQRYDGINKKEAESKEVSEKEDECISCQTLEQRNPIYHYLTQGIKKKETESQVMENFMMYLNKTKLGRVPYDTYDFYCKRWIPLQKLMEKEVGPEIVDEVDNDLEKEYLVGDGNYFSFSCIPEFFLLSSIFLFLSYGILMKLSKQKKFPDLKGHYLLLTVVILFFYFLLHSLYFVESNFIFNSYFYKTKETSLIAMILSLLGIFVCCIMQHYNEKENLEQVEYYILLLSSIFALSLLVQSNEMISFFFLLELQSISSYILAGFNRRYRITLQSGIKYFIVGGVSSIFVVIGLIFFYQLTGSTSFEDFKYFFLLESISNNFIFSLGIFFFTVGLFGKLYIFPFHWWILDVYEGAPSTTTLFFAALPYYSFFYILYKFYFFVFNGDLHHYWVYFFFGCYGSMLVGSIGAILQKKIKRLIGYSSIGMIGYTLTLFLSPHLDLYKDGVSLLIAYTTCLFLIFTFLFNGNFFYIKNNKTKDLSSLEEVHLLRGLQCNTYSKYLFAIGMYGILGLPPMPLFIQKLYLLQSLGGDGNWYLSFFFVLSSMISGYYYLYIVKELFYHKYPSANIKKGLVYSLSFNKLSGYLMSLFLFLQFYLLFSGINYSVFL